MTIASSPKSFDRPQPAPRGGAAVGTLSELSMADACAILSFRLWCDGMQTNLPDPIAPLCALAQSVAQTDGFARLMSALQHGPRRAIMHHGLGCACFGGDEAAFAHMVAAAAAGDTEDAMVFAMLLMTPTAAWAAVQAARPVGLALLGLRRQAPLHLSETRH